MTSVKEISSQPAPPPPADFSQTLDSAISSQLTAQCQPQEALLEFLLHGKGWLLLNAMSVLATQVRLSVPIEGCSFFSLSACHLMMHLMKTSNNVCVSESLFACSVDWLIDWLMVSLIDELIDWMVGCPINEWIDWLIDWLNDWMIDWWFHWLMSWLIEWSVVR